MDNTLFLRFISNILSIRTCCISREDDSLAAFEKECCFERTLQPMYTAEYLAYLIDHTNAETFYEITDYLNTNLFLFQFDGKHYLLGPYVKSTFSTEEMQELLASHKLPAGILLPLKLYYSRFPQLSYNMLQGTTLAAMRTFIPTTPDYSYRRLMGFHEDLKKEELVLESTKTYMQILQQYEMENFFLRKITEGDVDGVRLAFESITSNFYASSDASQRSLYATNSNGFAVLRTLARKAAEQGGCPVVKIDEITQESIQRYANARSSSEVESVQKDMLVHLTQAVSAAKKLARFSPVIRDVLSYLSTNYTQNITLQELAKRNHISAEHLSRTFKKEVGKTISDFIAELRTKKAAELLKNSKLSVSEIAMYVGYPDSNYFVKVFKKRYGMPPSAYR